MLSHFDLQGEFTIYCAKYPVLLERRSAIVPLYEFRCHACGLFDLWRTMAESDSPAYCPSCQEPAKRIFSPPMLLSGSLRLKQENPEPTLVKRPERETERPRAQTHVDGRP